jgi:tetratricopeptide (TPR) repeat protein
MATDPSTNQPNPTASLGHAVISPSQRKQLQRCFERAKEVLRQEKPDHDYAHNLFSQCVLTDPSNLEYVESMLDNLQRKYNNNKRGSRLMGFGGRGPFKKAVAAQDWEQVFQLGLELLQTNPWDVTTLRALAQACQANHFNEVELRYLKNALDVNRKDLEVNRHCAESLARMGQFDQAIACWHRIEELDKGNVDARRKISELTLAKARGLPGVEVTATTKSGAKTGASTGAKPGSPAPAASQGTASSSTAAQPVPAPAGRNPAVELPEPSKGAAKPGEPALDVSQCEAAVQRDPTNPEAYVHLAEAYTQAQRYRDAIPALKRALDAAGGNNLEIRYRLEEAQIRMVRAQVAIAEERAAAEATSEAHDLVRRFRSELNRQELQVVAARCDRFPGDMSLRYELGIRLKREANYREALKAFEAARSVADLRASATLEMGECFQYLKQYSNAMKCYQSAAAAAARASEPHKVALYRAAVLAMALKHPEAASQYLTDLVALDPGFRDAAARLDKLRQIGDKE